MGKTIADLVYRLGRRVRGFREAQGLSQEHVAHEAGVSVRHYYLIETGKGNPTASTLFGIARALEVSPRDLMDDDQRIRRPGAKR